MKTNKVGPSAKVAVLILANTIELRVLEAGNLIANFIFIGST